MKFRPLHDRVVVRRIESDERTAGGIIIPDTAKEKPQEGEIIAVGPGARDESGKLVPLDVKAGDRILFGKWSGTEVKIDGQDYLIMKESDVMGILEGRAAGKKADLPFQVHAHMLRHSTGYKLANDNADTRSIQSYLGHRDIRHTVRYTELSAKPFRDFFRD